MNTHSPHWPRAIILVDMNAFFASIEQMDFPRLRGKPVAVTNGQQGSCIITCSYEARAQGVKTGMRFRDGQRLCAQLIRCPSRPQRYAEISTRIMAALNDITPDMEIFSVDEAFLDVTHCQRLHGDPVKIAHMAKRRVWEASQLLCSVGVSGDKTTAKYAAKCVKPDGFTVIPPWESKARLRDVPVTELCGIATGIGRFLQNYGVRTCGDMEKLPISVLARRFGNLGRRLWYMCQGADPEPVHTSVADPKSMGHGKVMPPGTRDTRVILTYLSHMSEKLGARLRRHGFCAQQFFIGVKTDEAGWISEKLSLEFPSDDGRTIFYLCEQMFERQWQAHFSASQVQVTALDPQPHSLQDDLFAHVDPHAHLLNNVIDSINRRYGELKIAPAQLLKRSETPNVIAPAWKPEGHRQSV